MTRPFLTRFCTLHLSPVFVSPSFPSVHTAFHSVVLGDTYNIPLDPRGKQQGSAAQTQDLLGSGEVRGHVGSFGVLPALLAPCMTTFCL